MRMAIDGPFRTIFNMQPSGPKSFAEAPGTPQLHAIGSSPLNWGVYQCGEPITLRGEVWKKAAAPKPCAHLRHPLLSFLPSLGVPQ